MSILVDLILISFFVFKIVAGYKKGLTGMLFGLARIILSFAISAMAAPIIADALGNDGMLTGIILYITVFVAVYVACSVVIYLLKQVKIPVVSTIDNCMGGAVGALNGFLGVSIIAVMLYSILFAVSRISPESTVFEIYESSHIFKFINENNIFGFIKDILIRK